MEKLAGSASTPSSDISNTPKTPATPSSESKVSPAATSTNNPFVKLGEQKPTNNVATSSINIRPADNSAKRIRVQDQDTEGSTPRKIQETRPDNIDDWESKSISNIFRLTLDQAKSTDHNGHRLIYLPSLREELADSQAEIRFSVATLDTALIEAITKYSHSKSPLDYLLPCWKRVLKAQKGLKGYVNDKDAILKEARRLCMSYCIFAITVPELFSRESNPAVDSLVPYLLNNSDADNGIDMDFVRDAVARFEEDDTVKGIFTKAMAGLSGQLSRLDMNGDYKPYVNVSFQPLDDVVVWCKSPRWTC